MEKKIRSEKINVVILDSDPTYLKMWEKIFSKFPNCNYSITNDTKAATNIIKLNKPDLVISEVVLPDSNGYSVAELTHKIHPATEVLLTTSYDCDLTRFDLENPHFSILYKPYKNMEDIQRFIKHLLSHENVFDDVSEDSFSENDTFPSVMEWKL